MSEENRKKQADDILFLYAHEVGSRSDEIEFIEACIEYLGVQLVTKHLVAAMTNEADPVFAKFCQLCAADMGAVSAANRYVRREMAQKLFSGECPLK